MINKKVFTQEEKNRLARYFTLLIEIDKRNKCYLPRCGQQEDEIEEMNRRPNSFPIKISCNGFNEINC